MDFFWRSDRKTSFYKWSSNFFVLLFKLRILVLSPQMFKIFSNDAPRATKLLLTFMLIDENDSLKTIIKFDTFPEQNFWSLKNTLNVKRSCFQYRTTRVFDFCFNIHLIYSFSLVEDDFTVSSSTKSLAMTLQSEKFRFRTTLLF